MKKLIIALLLASTAASAETTLVGGNVPIQAFAPNGTLSQLLTIASTTIDMTGYAQYAVYAASGTTCFKRLMPTSTKPANPATYVASPVLPVTTWIHRAKNPATPFVNMTGCTGGYVEIQ